MINSIISANFEQYDVYSESTQISSGLGVLILAFFFCLVLYFEKYQESKDSVLFKFSLISYLFVPLGLIISMLGRIGLYFEVVNIAVFPLLYPSFRKYIWKQLPILVIVLFTLNSFFRFFYSDTYKAAFSTYHTIFSAFY